MIDYNLLHEGATPDSISERVALEQATERFLELLTAERALAESRSAKLACTP